MQLFITFLLWITYGVSLYFSLFLLLIFLDKDIPVPSLKASPRKYPFVSVFIPAYNEENTILETLRSVAALEYPSDRLEVIVVNDGSTDATEERIQQFIQSVPPFSFRMLSHPNQGKAASLNRALHEARGDYFACLDADSFVEPSALQQMIVYREQHPEPKPTIITPVMKVHQPKNLLQKMQWLEYIVMIFFTRLASRIDSLYVAPGPFSLYHTSTIRRLGGFDPRSLTEDQEIAYRVQEQQLLIKQCPEARVFTTAPSSWKKFYRQRRRWYLGSMACLYQYKHLIAQRKYGDFGVMQLVKNVAGYFLAFTGIVLGVYLVLWPLLNKVKDLFLIHFQITPYLQHLNLQVTIWDLLLTNFQLVFLLVFLTSLGFVFFTLAHRNAQEKMNAMGFLPLVPYSLVYYLVKGSIFLLALAHTTRKRRTRW